MCGRHQHLPESRFLCAVKRRLYIRHDVFASNVLDKPRVAQEVASAVDSVLLPLE
jgi:hypothetical protein